MYVVSKILLSGNKFKPVGISSSHAERKNKLATKILNIFFIIYFLKISL
jgi:hypothetical protein